MPQSSLVCVRPHLRPIRELIVDNDPAEREGYGQDRVFRTFISLLAVNHGMATN